MLIKKLIALMACTFVVFGNAVTFADSVRIKDDFSGAAKDQWQMTGANGEHGGAQYEYKDGTISLSGSCMKKIEIDSIHSSDFTGQVDFYLSEGDHQGWESAAITLFGEPATTRAYFMVIFGQPGRQGDQRRIGLYENQMITKDMPAGKWYTIKVSMTGGDGKMRSGRKMPPNLTNGTSICHCRATLKRSPVSVCVPSAQPFSMMTSILSLNPISQSRFSSRA
jgi:hypothetical protein